MSIFNKKKGYVLVTDMATNLVVQDFAKKHCAEGREIDVHVHGCLLEGDNLVTITFVSDEDEPIVYSDMIDAFGTNYRLAMRRKLIFVFQKVEES